MFDKPFQLQIITPTRVVLKEEALSISAPGTMGGFQVLHNHAPLLSSLEVGEIKVRKKDGSEIRYATSGGFLEVKANEVVVLADSAESSSEIDVERARQAKERATSRLHSKDPAVDTKRAYLAILRATNRIRTASKA